MFDAAVWIVGSVLLWAPGFVLTNLSRRARAAELSESIARSLAAGLCLWPLLLLWTTTVGLRIEPSAARAISAFALIGAVVLMFRRRLRITPRIGITILIVVAITAVTRVAHVRDLVLPAWVDSVHHTAIVRVIVETGHVPQTYDPLIPESVAFYHWGFHATAAFLCWILGATDPFDVARVLLHFGQLLNVAVVVMMYAAARTLFRNWRAGAIAAAITGLVSYFPAYYVSWGRYTHLAGLLVFLAFAPALWRTFKRRSIHEMLVTALFAAGLILVHARIAFFALTFAVALAAIISVVIAREPRAVRRASRPRPGAGRWRFLVRWSLAALIAGLLASPWLIQLSQMQQTSGILAPREAEWTTPSDVRANHLWVPRNRELLSFATGGLSGILGWPKLSVAKRIASGALWITVMLATERVARRKGRARRSPRNGLILLVAWITITAALLNLDALGLPRLQFASNTAAVISLFIPLALASAGLAAWILITFIPRPFLRGATAGVVVIISVAGAAGMMNVVNPATVLAHAPDYEALKWIRDNVPADARFGIRARQWLGGSWVGVDGGYWISVLTGRRSVLPPALYMWASAPPVASRINATLSEFSRADTLTDDSLRDMFSRERINYLYFGRNAGEPHPARFENVAFADLVYDRDGVKIFRVR